MAKKNETSEIPAPVDLLEVPAVSMAMVEMATARALARAAHNAATAQQVGDIVMAATTARGVQAILGGDKQAERLFELIEKKLAG